MGNSSSPEGLNKQSTAKDVLEACGSGEYLNGKTAIVTGGNSGIGLETVKILAYAGCRVILCSRSVPGGLQAIQDEISQPGEGGYVVSDISNIVVKSLDLQDLKSIKSFAADVLSSQERIDFLVLNAGIMALPTLEYTSAGFEKQIGTNHFGHAYLTLLLLDYMKKQDFPSRIVVLSSLAHKYGSVIPSDLHYKNGRSYAPRGWEAYGQSKKANILFAKSLADKLPSNITAVSVHPGVIKTKLYRTTSLDSGIISVFMSHFIMDKTIPQGAASTVYACLHPEVAEQSMRGAYIVNCAPDTPTADALNSDLREEFWLETVKQLEAATGDKLLE